MIPHMMDQFRQSQAAQVAAEANPLRNIEIKRTVQWQLYHGTEPREATFLAATDGASEVMDLRLVRVWAGTVWHNRKEALFFQQPVRAWETEAEAAFRAECAA